MYTSKFLSPDAQLLVTISHRGMEIMKGPLDIIVFQQLFWHLKPRTVIELGTYNGTCALWLSDVMKLISSPCQVYTMDIDSSLLLPEVKALAGDSVSYLQGDANRVDRYYLVTIDREHNWRLKHSNCFCSKNDDGYTEIWIMLKSTGNNFCC